VLYDGQVTSSAPAPVPTVQVRAHRASRIEDSLRRVVVRVLRRRGWVPRVLPYAGYGTGGRVRVLGRVLLCPPGACDVESPGRRPDGGRGWRRFFSAAVSDIEVRVEIAGQACTLVSGRGGFLDHVVDADPPPGRQVALLSIGGLTARAPLHVVPPGPTLGLLSDIDDTVMITALPRPLLAFWNTFVRHESSRRPVPGMARLYQEVLRRHPDAFVAYLSTGAWNVAPPLTAFLERHGYPAGPLLLTDWGPTEQGWFRSGAGHKRTELRRLLADLPQVRWLLVGDDGQLDPVLYGEVAAEAPDRIRAVAIRQLTASQQILTHGTPSPLPEVPPAGATAPAVTEVRAPDGDGLLTALDAAGALSTGTDEQG
jgi:phosphatidate phosphatase APP1